jgi:hypothetical protein
MEPISAAVASIVTGFLIKGATQVAETAGAAVTEAARSIAQTVLDRLKADPEEKRTVERYENDPERQQPAIEAAIEQLVTADQAFAVELGRLVAAYEQAKQSSGGIGVEVHGNVGGSVQSGDHGILVDRNTGDVRIGRDTGGD